MCVSASMSLCMVSSGIVNGDAEADTQGKLNKLTQHSCLLLFERPKNATFGCCFSNRVKLFLGFSILLVSWMPWGDDQLQLLLESGKMFSAQAPEN